MLSKYLMLVALWIFSTSVFAHNKIAFIDAKAVIMESNQGLALKRLIKLEYKKHQEEIYLDTQNMNSLEKRSRNETNPLKKKSFDKNIEALSKRLQLKINAYEDKIRRLESKGLIRLRSMLDIVVHEWRVNNGYDVVYDSAATIAIDRKIMVSRQVLEQFNLKFPKSVNR